MLQNYELYFNWKENEQEFLFAEFKIAACWILPVLVSIPSFFGIYGRHGLECYSRSCTVINDPNGQNPKMILKGLGLIAPIVILTIADVSILWKMRVSYMWVFLIVTSKHIRTEWIINQIHVVAFRRYQMKLIGLVRRWV